MAMTVEARHKLHQRLDQVLGVEEATTFMEHMPPVGWADVATKRDLDAQSLLTKRDLDAHAIANKADLDAQSLLTRRDLDAHAIANKADLHAHAIANKADLRHLGSELRSEMRLLEANVRADLANGLRLQTYAILGGGSLLVGLGTALSQLLT